MLNKEGYEAMAEMLMKERATQEEEVTPVHEKIINQYTGKIGEALKEFHEKYPEEFTFEFLDHMVYGERMIDLDGNPTRPGEARIVELMQEWFNLCFPD